MMKTPPDFTLRARIAATGVVAAALLGAAANMVNGWISPTYFVTVLQWSRDENVWIQCVVQGLCEGLLFGTVFTLIFIFGVSVRIGGAIGYGFAARRIAVIMAGAVAGWFIGGLLAMELAVIFPQFYQQVFIGVPQATEPRIAYAWVGGSIWGLQLGGLASVLVAIVWRSPAPQGDGECLDAR